MKTNKFFQLFTLAVCALAFAFVTGCEGPEGPVGPKGDTGDTGATGAQGVQGEQGIAGNVTCLECHSDDVIQIVQEAFHQSQHASGAIAVDYAGGRAGCAECHSHEGYLEFARTGDVAADIVNPSAWQCKTCHNIHTTFEGEDLAFRLGDAVTLIADGTTVFDAGNNNTCANCHQARRAVGDYDNATEDKQYTREFTGADRDIYLAHGAVGPNGSKTDDGTTLTVVFDVPLATHSYISSTHAGPHHGPQANLWSGVAGAAVDDGAIFGAHEGGCVVCHMGPDSGHSFMPKDANCQVEGCHSASKEDALDAFEVRLVAVGMALEQIGAVHFDEAGFDDTEEYWGNFHPMYASLTKEEFSAWWNFIYLLEDRSNSAHNPTYAKALLEQAEGVLGL